MKTHIISLSDCLLFIIMGALLIGCNSSEELLTTRKSYHFTDKKIIDTGNNELPRPIKYRSGNDIQLEITQFNPIKHEIIVEDSALPGSLGDTAKLAQMIILPNIKNLAEGEPATQEIADATAGLSSSSNAIQSAYGKMAVIRRSAVRQVDCDQILGYMKILNAEKEAIEEQILEYKNLMSQMDIISDDFEYLKGPDALTAQMVNDRLNISILARLNNFLPSDKRLDSTNNLVSSRQLAELEAVYYKAVVDNEADLEEIKRLVDELKGNCTDFVKLYKSFADGYQKIRDGLKDFKTARVDKVVPAFNKKLVMYDDMKRYTVSDPKYVTKAISIENEKHTISIYKKAPGSETKVLHDYINIEPTRGFKLSVAGGIFVSGLTDQSFSKKTKDSIYTSKYLLNGVSRDTTKSETFTSLYEKDQDDISYGGMLFLQAQSRNASMVNYGGFVGFGAIFNDQTRWAGSIGGSLLIGKSQKFNINIGAVIGQVERLTQPYQTNTWYRETVDNIPTYKAWDVSWMVGFSWSFK